MSFTTNLSLTVVGQDPTVDASSSTPLSQALTLTSILPTGVGFMSAGFFVALVPTQVFLPAPPTGAQYLLISLQPSGVINGPVGASLIVLTATSSAVTTVTVPDGGMLLMPLINLASVASINQTTGGLLAAVQGRVLYF